MMLRFLSVIFVVLSLAGCETFSKKDSAPGTGVKNQRADATFVSGQNDSKMNALLSDYIEQTALKEVIKASCTGASQEATTESFDNVIAAGGKYLFDRWMEKRSEDLKELKKIAVRSYSQTVILPSADFQQKRCALVYRYDATTKKIGLIALLSLKDHGEGLTFTPTFVKASNALAVTRKTKGGSATPISTSFAVAVKAIGTRQNGLPELGTLGSGVASVDNISLKEGAHYQCVQRNCERSEIIPYLPDRTDAVVSVTFSVTEIGDVGFNIDKKIGRIEAIKEALGPAIKSDIDDALEED